MTFVESAHHAQRRRYGGDAHVVAEIHIRDFAQGADVSSLQFVQRGNHVQQKPNEAPALHARVALPNLLVAYLERPIIHAFGQRYHANAGVPPPMHY